MRYALLFMLGLPLVGAILNGLILRPKSARRAGVLATLCAGGSFVCAILLWRLYLELQGPISIQFPWMVIGNTSLDWGFTFDALTLVMALVITGIGSLIHLYSLGYMAEDPSVGRYFAYLNLFLFNMLLLVCADNLLVLFVGWEGVGLCSYLLIGFWFTDLEKSNAGMKAFLVNRIGDAAFLIGIFLCFWNFGSLQFSAISSQLGHAAGIDLRILNLIALCLFLGATGKSAQIPLYIWLPDAMAGPTPVSALIHAATMVTAGIYLTVRMGFLFHLTEVTNQAIALVGISTALLAALIACCQKDIKKVLAYSTVSQLGLMFLALGVQAYVAALFHVVTHAFFKGLLFLGAGSVIHGLHGEQDIEKMGGLKEYMPVTHLTFLLGTLAIAGIPPLAGFFSKDAILYHALGAHNGFVLWCLGLLVSLLTAFYMARLYASVFQGKFRGDSHVHPHESGLLMLLPLIALTVGSVFAGVLGLPHFLGFWPELLQRSLEGYVPVHEMAETFLGEIPLMGIASAVGIVGVGIGLWMYGSKKETSPFGNQGAGLRWLLFNKFYVDEIYGWVFVRPFKFLSKVLSLWVDRWVIDASILFPGRLVRLGSITLSFLSFGSLQAYLLLMALGVVALVGWVAHSVGGLF